MCLLDWSRSLVRTNQILPILCYSLFTGQHSGVLGVEEPYRSISNLVMKPYRGNDTAGGRGLDARMKENREEKIRNALHSRNGRLYREPHPAHPSLPPHLVRGKWDLIIPQIFAFRLSRVQEEESSGDC